jgi:hypothetical protein
MSEQNKNLEESIIINQQQFEEEPKKAVEVRYEGNGYSTKSCRSPDG